MRRRAGHSGLATAVLAALAAGTAVPVAATPYTETQSFVFSASRQLNIDFAVPTAIAGPMTLTLTLTGQFVQNSENATLLLDDPAGDIDFGTVADNNPNNDLFPGADPNVISATYTLNLAESLIAPLILDGALNFFATVSGAVAVTTSPPRPIIQLTIAWEVPETVAVPAPAAGLLFATGIGLMAWRRRRAG